MNDNIERFELPPILKEFRKNVPHAKFDNLYLLETIDMDGNVVDTKVGMNLMTNYALGNIWETHYAGYASNRKIYLGSGAGTLDPDESRLFEYISALGPGTNQNGGIEFVQGNDFEYDSDNNILTVCYKGKQAMWDYTAGGDSSYTITEIGMGDSQTSLYTHAFVYDSGGTSSYIYKEPNTRLYITQYYTFAANVTCLSELYNKGVYGFISPEAVAMFGTGLKYYVNTCARGHFAVGADSGGIRGYLGPFYTTDTLDENAQDSTRKYAYGITGPDPDNNESWFLESEWNYRAGVFLSSEIRGIYSERNDQINSYDWFMLTYDELPVSGYNEVKHIEYEHTYVNYLDTWFSRTYGFDPVIADQDDYVGLDQMFGVSLDTSLASYKGRIPAVQFDIGSLCQYNHLTHDWDIAIPHINSPTVKYMYTHNKVCGILPIEFDGVSRNARVFVNPHASKYHITKFNNSNMNIAATDAYWDTSTWEKIGNLANVDLSLQQKRYYIVYDGTLATLKPVYAEEVKHRVSPTHRAYEVTLDTNCPKDFNMRGDRGNIYPAGTGTDYGPEGTPLSSQNKGYFVNTSQIVFLDANKNCTYYDFRDDDNCLFSCEHKFVTGTGDKIVTMIRRETRKVGTSTTFTRNYDVAKNRIYITTIVDANTQPDIQYVDLLFTGDTNNSTYHYYTWSDNGYFVAQRRETVNEAVVLSVYGDGTTPTQKLISDCKHCVALNLTSTCVYQDMTNTTGTTYAFNVYDMETDTIVHSFQINEGVEYTINALWGWRDIVYISLTSAGVRSTKIYKIADESFQTISFTDTTIDTSSGSPYRLLHKSCDECYIYISRDSYVEMNIFKYDDPANPILVQSANTRNDSNTVKTNLCVGTQLARLRGGKQLLFSALCPGTNGVTIYIDIGYIIDNGSIDRIPRNHTINISGRSNNGNTSYSTGISCFLNDGVILVNGNQASTPQGKIYWLPIDYLLPMKISGETTTINSFNQPLRFWGKTSYMKISNDWTMMTTRDW